MFDRFMQELQPQSDTTIVDVGVTNDSRIDSNFFEKLYPHNHSVTAVGLEDASFLEIQHPGMKFVRADGLQLPFADKTFDIAVSWAVIEHVGSRENQKQFLKELCRVAKRCCVTTPNRWYPIEFHTLLPLVHWLPPETFRSICKSLGKEFFAQEQHLNLLGRDDLFGLAESGMDCRFIPFRLAGSISNLMMIIE